MSNYIPFYQLVVAKYQVKSSDDEQDLGDHAQEHDGLINYHQVISYIVNNLSTINYY